MTRSDLDDLCLEVHFGGDLVESDVLDRLQDSLASLAPKMFASLEVHAYERDRDRLRLAETAMSLREAVVARGTSRGATYAVLAAESAPAEDRRFGSVLLRGRGPGTGGSYVSVNFDTHVPARRSGSQWLWSNSIDMSISASTVEGSPRATWLQEFAGAVSRHPAFLWGTAYLRQEFAASNLDTSEGMRAIGRDVRQHLPGVFWLNLFGKPYRELIGESVVRSAPAAVVDEDACRTILRPFEEPEDWPGQLQAKDRLRQHLGPDIFFDRSHPDRTTRAPDLGLQPLPELRPFQVFTSDGVHYTPLPPA